VATKDDFPLSLSDHAEKPEQSGIGTAWDGAVISPRILKTGIFGVTAAAIIFVILSNATAFLVAASAPQDGSGVIQSTAGAQAFPSTATKAPTGDEIETADQSQTEIRQPPTHALLDQFQAWAADEDARADVRPLQPEVGTMKGPLLGTDPAINREEAKVDKMVKSICRGC